MAEKKEYVWWKVLILSIVTCGIYFMIVMNNMAKTNNELAEKYGEETIKSFIVALLLGIVTCGIYFIYWVYKFQDLQVKVAEKSGVAVAPTNNAIVLLLITYVPVYQFYALCDNYNRTIAAN